MRRLLSSLLLLLLAAPVLAQTVTMGDTSQEANGDNGNANLLIAQQATLSTAATLQSLSFDVNVAAGSLILGVYDNSGSGGNPGKLLATTASFTAVKGWNSQPVLTPVPLPVGTYWLAYAPSSNTLSFYKQNNSGPCGVYKRAFAALPTSWGTTGFGACTPTTWSFYATLVAENAPVFSGPYDETGTIITTGTAVCVQLTPTTLSCEMTPPL